MIRFPKSNYRGRIMLAKIVSIASVIVSLTTAAQAGETVKPLQGAWAQSSLSCSQVFSNEGGKVSLRKLDDFNVGGFIIEGDKIRGQSQSCLVSHAKQRGSNIDLIMQCQDSVMAATQDVHLQLQKDGSLTRKFTGFNEFTQSYKRCP